MDEQMDEQMDDIEFESNTEEAVEHVESVLGELNIEEVIKERDEFKDIALRVQADFENYRKRASAQVMAEVDRSGGIIIEALLPVLDACEAAVGHGFEGVEPVFSSLLGVLQKKGLEVLDLNGKVFDPVTAEAVVHEEGDNGEVVITEVLRTGYRWKGRVLRAAMVKVKG
ncbi:MAG: nucleotide exchange factor GrpE [Actinomycetota bacterium]